MVSVDDGKRRAIWLISASADSCYVAKLLRRVASAVADRATGRPAVAGTINH